MADSIAMQHDIDYLTKTEPIISDFKAIVRGFAQGGVSLSNIALILGLSGRSAVDRYVHKLPVRNFTHINGDLDEERDAKLLESARSQAAYLGVADLTSQHLGFH